MQVTWIWLGLNDRPLRHQSKRLVGDPTGLHQAAQSGGDSVMLGGWRGLGWAGASRASRRGYLTGWLMR